MNRRFALVALAVMSLTGCGDKPKPLSAPAVAPPPGTVRKPEAPPAVTNEASVQVPSTKAEALSTIERQIATPNPEVYLKTLTDLLNGWVMSKNSFPTNVDEFVKAKMITRLPVPPPGKQLSIDRKAMRVVLVDR